VGTPAFQQPQQRAPHQPVAPSTATRRVIEPKSGWERFAEARPRKKSVG
jgi:hypothetical protein